MKILLSLPKENKCFSEMEIAVWTVCYRTFSWQWRMADARLNGLAVSVNHALTARLDEETARSMLHVSAQALISLDCARVCLCLILYLERKLTLEQLHRSGLPVLGIARTASPLAGKVSLHGHALHSLWQLLCIAYMSSYFIILKALTEATLLQ